MINLFAGAIDNSGSMISPSGQINLAVGEQISFLNNGLGFQVVVDQSLKDKVVGFNNAITNSGSLIADGGLVRLQTDLTNNIYNLAVNNSGIIQASALAGKDGYVELVTDDSLSSNNNGHVLNSGSIASSGNTYLQVSTLENNGSISSDADVNILALGLRTITRANPDWTLLHIPGDFPTGRNPYQTISFSILNDPNSSISAGNDINILTKVLYNTSGTIESVRDLNIQADLLVNERAGFYTEHIPWFWGPDPPRESPYIPGLFEESPNFQRYEYWLDRQSTLQPGTLTSGRDINLLVKNTLNQDSLIESARDLNVKGDNFTNAARILLGTQYHFWKANGSKKQWRTETIGGSSSSVLVGENANFDLTGTFNNSSIVSVTGNLAIKANNANIGIQNNTIQTPQVTRLPSTLLLPFWEDIPFDSDKNILGPFRDIVGREIKNILFNLTGKTYLGNEYKTAKDILAELEANRKLAMLKDPTLTWGEELTQEQIANLDSPILWYQIGADGKGRLVVYIPPSYQSENSPEGLMTANNISFDIQNKFQNTGTIIANNNLDVNANEIVNEARTVTREQSVRVNTGLFRGHSEKVYYQEIQRGGNLVGNNITLNANRSITNRGGSISALRDPQGANGTVILKAPVISNEAQRGSEVITWKSTFADKLFGNKNTYSLKPVFQGASITGNDVLISGDTVQNLGSDIFGQNKVSIKATDSFTNSWLTGTYTVKDNFSVKFRPTSFSLNKDATTAHVIQGASVGSGGDVEIQTNTFNNVAADVYAGNNINVQANNINITDATVKSTDKHSSLMFKTSLPATSSINYSDTKSTHSSHQSSNFVAGNDINITSPASLTGGAISITGSNLAAGNKISLSGKDVTIQNGLYADTSNTKGGSVFAALRGGLMLGGATFFSNGEVQTLTPSSLIAKDILLNAGNNTNIKASILKADNSLEINTPNLNITGEYEKANSTNGGTSANIIIGPNGPVGGGIGISYGYSKQGTYIESNLSAPTLVLNSPSQNIDGAVINGQEINPHSNYSEGHQFSGSVGVGNSGLTLGVGLDDYSLFAGGGSSGAFVGAGYKEFSLGTGLGKNANGSRTASVFGSAYGLGLDLTRSINNPGITNDHPIWTASAGYGPLSISGDFQHGELKTLSEGFLFWNKSQSINQLDTVCFEKDAPIEIKQGTKFIQDIKVGDLVKTWNEDTKQFEYKEVLNTFERTAEKTLHISLSNGQLMKVTPEHRVLVNGIWKTAGEIKIGDKLLGSSNEEIEVLRIETVNKTTQVYNFETKDNHTYIAYGAVVHNRCDPNNPYLVAWKKHKASGGTASDFKLDVPVTDQDFLDFMSTPEGNAYVSELGITNQQFNKALAIWAAGESAVLGFAKWLGEFINNGNNAILKDGFYEVNGFKFSKYYYEKLWGTGRGAPSLTAREVLNGATNPIKDPIKSGFNRYEYGGWEMIYNPSTKEVWHLQPIK